MYGMPFSEKPESNFSFSGIRNDEKTRNSGISESGIRNDSINLQGQVIFSSVGFKTTFEVQNRKRSNAVVFKTQKNFNLNFIVSEKNSKNRNVKKTRNSGIRIPDNYDWWLRNPEVHMCLLYFNNILI